LSSRFKTCVRLQVSVALSVQPADAVSVRVVADGQGGAKVQLALAQTLCVKLLAFAASASVLPQRSCAKPGEAERATAETPVQSVAAVAECVEEEEQVVRVALQADEPSVCVALRAAQSRSESRCAVASLIQAAMPELSLSMQVINPAPPSLVHYRARLSGSQASRLVR
jgi:hypothetical protein